MSETAIIMGAGPAGLTAAADFLSTTDIVPIVLEKSTYTAPWIAREIRIMPRDVAAPQLNDAAVKIRMQTNRKLRRPNRSENQLLVGRITAFATR